MDGHGSDFVTVTGQILILMAVQTGEPAGNSTLA